MDWRTTARLGYRLLDLPNDVRAANAHNNASAPDFDELFDEREDPYSQLGLKACPLTPKLRNHCRVPSREFVELLESCGDTLWHQARLRSALTAIAPPFTAT